MKLVGKLLAYPMLTVNAVVPDALARSLEKGSAHAVPDNPYLPSPHTQILPGTLPELHKSRGALHNRGNIQYRGIRVR